MIFADDIDAVSKIVGKEITQEDGKQYMRTEKLLVDFSVGKSRFRIRDYINDGNILGKGDVARTFTALRLSGYCMCR
jgi:hypothetical protein